MTKDKLIISVLVFLVSFVILQFLVNYLFSVPYGHHMGMIQTQDIYNLIIVVILSALIAAFVYSKFGYNDELQEQSKNMHILKKALNDDEKRLIEEIEKAGVITQDSLRFRLDWSKAKLSTLLSNLDRQGIIQRERSGKTYRVFLQKEL